MPPDSASRIRRSSTSPFRRKSAVPLARLSSYRRTLGLEEAREEHDELSSHCRLSPGRSECFHSYCMRERSRLRSGGARRRLELLQRLGKGEELRKKRIAQLLSDMDAVALPQRDSNVSSSADNEKMEATKNVRPGNKWQSGKPRRGRGHRKNDAYWTEFNDSEAAVSDASFSRVLGHTQLMRHRIPSIIVIASSLTSAVE